MCLFVVYSLIVIVMPYCLVCVYLSFISWLFCVVLSISCLLSAHELVQQLGISCVLVCVSVVYQLFTKCLFVCISCLFVVDGRLYQFGISSVFISVRHELLLRGLLIGCQLLSSCLCISVVETVYQLLVAVVSVRHELQISVLLSCVLCVYQLCIRAVLVVYAFVYTLLFALGISCV